MVAFPESLVMERTTGHSCFPATTPWDIKMSFQPAKLAFGYWTKMKWLHTISFKSSYSLFISERTGKMSTPINLNFIFKLSIQLRNASSLFAAWKTSQISLYLFIYNLLLKNKLFPYSLFFWFPWTTAPYPVVHVLHQVCSTTGITAEISRNN